MQFFALHVSCSWLFNLSSKRSDGKAPGLLLPSGNSIECIWARVQATSRYTLCWGGVCLCGSFPIIIIFVFIVFAIIGSVCFPSIHLLIVLVVILIFLSLDSPVVPAALALQLDQRRTEDIWLIFWDPERKKGVSEVPNKKPYWQLNTPINIFTVGYMLFLFECHLISKTILKGCVKFCSIPSRLQQFHVVHLTPSADNSVVFSKDKMLF